MKHFVVRNVNWFPNISEAPLYHLYIIIRLELIYINQQFSHDIDLVMHIFSGLMISGLAKAAIALNDGFIRDMAIKTATFVHKEMYRDDTNTLLRTHYVKQDETESEGWVKNKF